MLTSLILIQWKPLSFFFGSRFFFGGNEGSADAAGFAPGAGGGGGGPPARPSVRTVRKSQVFHGCFDFVFPLPPRAY
jgi:hypothetical protein